MRMLTPWDFIRSAEIFFRKNKYTYVSYSSLYIKWIRENCEQWSRLSGYNKVARCYYYRFHFISIRDNRRIFACVKLIINFQCLNNHNFHIRNQHLLIKNIVSSSIFFFMLYRCCKKAKIRFFVIQINVIQLCIERNIHSRKHDFF